MLSFTSIPEDVLLAIMRYLTVTDVLAVRQTCTHALHVTQYKEIWVRVLKYEVPRGSVAPYAKPLDDLSSAQVEALALHSLRLRASLDSHREPVSIVQLNLPRSVTWVRLIQGTWLVAASSDRSSSVLSLWNVRAALSSRDTSSPPAPKAEAYLDGPVSNGYVDVQDGRVIVALDIRSSKPSIRIVSVCDSDHSPRFVELVRLNGASRLRFVRGSFVGYALQDEISIPCIYNWSEHTLTKLRKTPDRLGGCAAMLMCDRFIVLVLSVKLEVYEHDLAAGNSSTHLIGSCGIPELFADAVLVFNREGAPDDAGEGSYERLRLCTIGDDGLHLYDIEVFGDTGQVVLHQIRHFYGDDFAELLSPAFGVTPDHLSWLHGRVKDWKPVAFESGWIPQNETQSLPSDTSQKLSLAISLSRMDMPALYCKGVHDLDETRGILALASAFGELVLYDFSGTSPQLLEECFIPVRFDTTPVGENMSTVPIEARATLPFPYCGPLVPEPGPILAEWARFQPDPPPPDWRTDFGRIEPREEQPWMRYVPAVGCYGRTLEHGSHMLGTPIPLMYQGIHLVVVQVGGILLFQDDGRGFALNPGITLDDIANAVAEERENNLPGPEITYQDCTQSEDQRFEAMWMWEWAELGRNRWQEMRDRGGDVDPCWTDVPRPERGWWSLMLRGQAMNAEADPSDNSLQELAREQPKHPSDEPLKDSNDDDPQ